LGSADGQIATTAFVQNAVTESTTGVASFNSRTGAVVLSGADLAAAGGALLNSPIFTGTPTGPTAAPGNNTAQLATTQFVTAAVAAATAGVTSFNGRSGAVTLTSADVGAVAVSSFNGREGAVNLIGNDVSAAGGALLASPAFLGTPTAPTAAPGTNSPVLATCAFVAAAIAAAASGVTSFNGRSGVVTLSAADLTGAGGALLASPAFSGVPSGPTAAPGANTTQLATCAFVTAAIAAVGATVTSFNSRTGAITLIANDISGAGGALLASPALTGTPTAPTAAPATSNTQLATTAFVNAALAAAPYLPLSGGTLTGALTPSAAGIVGVTTATNANVGAVGEILFTLISTGVSVGSGATVTVGTLALTAGDWDISGELWLNVGGAATILGGALNSSASFPAAPAQNASRSQLAASFTPSNQILALSPCRTVQSGPFTYYLTASATFSTGTVTATGKILARRAR
jgi:hypothetical protein